ncbi:MAG: polymerase sigma factor [Bryobacterales bacterium]|nr:polymerase sigma factor [Bryobacterales bacterium]
MTQCLQEWRAGDDGALARLASQVYNELRRLAGSVLMRHAETPTVQVTSLVHDLYLQLPDVQGIDWQSRGHFLNVAARMMRNILVDHARRRTALKRGSGAAGFYTDVGAEDPALQVDVMAVDRALDAFAGSYPRQARVVELRFFGGLTAAETAEVLRATGVESSLRTVERDWTFARAWLKNAIQPN